MVMDATITRRPIPGVAAVLPLVAVVGIAATALAGSGTHAQAVIGAGASALAASVAGVLIRRASRE
jgi:hypothetical protein